MSAQVLKRDKADLRVKVARAVGWDAMDGTVHRSVEDPPLSTLRELQETGDVTEKHAALAFAGECNKRIAKALCSLTSLRVAVEESEVSSLLVDSHKR